MAPLRPIETLGSRRTFQMRSTSVVSRSRDDNLSASSAKLDPMTHRAATAALDIETTGLDPEASRVVAVAVDTESGIHSKVSDDESELLDWLNRLIESLPDNIELVTWNGEEFDMPFLRRRFEVRRIPTLLQLRPRHKKGKYGGLLYSVSWGRKRHCDIAPIFQHIAEDRQVAWSLKPVARVLLDTSPIEVDRRGSAIEKLSNARLRDYVESDARITRALFEWLTSGEPDRRHSTI